MKKEYKIGLTFLLALLLLFVIVKWLQNEGALSTVSHRRTLKAFFSDIGGLGPGDPVFVYGLKKGRVESFNLLPKGVEVMMDIDAEVKVYEDAYAGINMKELMGGKKIDLFPGTNIYDKTDSIRGISSMDISQVMSKFGRVFADMSDQNLAFTIASFGNLSLKLAMIIESVNPQNLRQTMDGIDMIIRDINKMNVVNDASATIKNFNEVAIKINRTMNKIDSLPITADQTMAHVKKLLNDAEVTLTYAKNGLSSMQKVMDQMLDPTTTAGKFLFDKKLSSRLDTLLNKVEATLDIVSKNKMVVGVRIGSSK